MADTEKDFEADIERALCSKKGGWQKGDDSGYCLKKNNARAVDVGALIAFVKRTQPKAWAKVEKLAPINTEGKFYNAFDSDVRNFGLVYVLRHGFRFLGVSKPIRVKAVQTLSQLDRIHADKDDTSSLMLVFYRQSGQAVITGLGFVVREGIQ